MNTPNQNPQVEGWAQSTVTQDEGEKLIAAELRRREKAARIAPIAAPASESLDLALSRLATLQAQPRPDGDIAPHDLARVTELRSNAGIPARHRKQITAPGTPWQAAFDKLAARLGTGLMAALVGIQGTGKTQIGACLIEHQVRKTKTCKFSTAMDFFIDLKSTYDSDSQKSESSALQHYVSPSLLVLDEMDERSESQWENRMLFHMINKRYNAMKDTILISRRSEREFSASVGDSIQSRLNETGGTIVCDWPSFRNV